MLLQSGCSVRDIILLSFSFHVRVRQGRKGGREVWKVVYLLGGRHHGSPALWGGVI